MHVLELNCNIDIMATSSMVSDLKLSLMEIVNEILCKVANVTFTTVRILIFVKVIISLVDAMNLIISDILIFQSHGQKVVRPWP